MSGTPFPKEQQTRRAAWNKGTRKPGGEWRTCTAEGCRNRFYAKPSAVKRGAGLFCSRACAFANRPPVPAERLQRMSKSMRAVDRTGERNPGFKHGRKTGWNIRGWNPTHKGETCCRWCGSSDKLLHLHHAIPRSICPPEARRDLRNGITLCNSCHLSWHRGGLTLPRSIFTVDEWAYIASLALTGRDTQGWLDKHYPDLKEAA